MRQTHLVPAKYEDIRSALARIHRRLVTRCAVWCGAVLLLEVLYLWQYFSERIHPVGSAVIAAILFCIYPLHAGVVRFVTDRGWQGTVRDLKKRSYIQINGFAGGRHGYSRMGTRIEAHLYLHGKAGRSVFLEKHLPVRRKFILRDSEQELPYCIGDRVRCFRGCAYPVIVQRPGDDRYPPRVCVFCGKAEENRERQSCDFCGFSLIELPETVQAIEYGIDITDISAQMAEKL